MWHLQDRTFKRPIAELRLLLHCGQANKSPLHSACSSLLIMLVSDAMTETAYMASVCELGSSIVVNDGGFSLRVHGFDDKLLSLFLNIFGLFLKFRDRPDPTTLPEEIEEKRFDLVLESFRRNCTNTAMKASKLASGIRVACLRPTTWSSTQKVCNVFSFFFLCAYSVYIG